MTKKEYILKMLEKTNDKVLPIKKDLILLVETDAMGDGLIDVLVGMFKDAQKATLDEQSKKQLDSSVKFLDKLKKIESESHQRDISSMNELDEMLKNIYTAPL